MAIINKETSSTKTSSAAIYAGRCWYYGFTCVTGGSNRTIAIYDNATTNTGQIVENFTADANKTVDGHSHAIPVHCHNGIYLSMSGGTVVVYFKPIGME